MQKQKTPAPKTTSPKKNSAPQKAKPKPKTPKGNRASCESSPLDLHAELNKLYTLAQEKEQNATALAVLKFMNAYQHAQENLESQEQNNAFMQMDADYDEHTLDREIFKALAEVYATTRPQLAALAQKLCDTGL